MKKQPDKPRSRIIRNLLAVLLLAVFVFVAVKNWASLRAGWEVLRAVPGWWFFVGACLYAMTQFFGATSYYFLALRKVAWRELYVVEWASAGINRLLPAGAGSMGVHGLYLLKRKHSVAEAVAVVAMNNIVSISTHLFMLLLVFLFVPQDFTTQQLALPSNTPYIILGLLLALALLFGIAKIRRIVRRFMSELWSSFRKYERRKVALLKSAASVICITLTNVLLLFSAIGAVGQSLPFITVFVVFSVGVAFGALFPTPGGLGGVEAGLVAGLIGFGVEPALAIAVAILFRFATFWMPLVVGNIIFLLVRNKNLF